MEEWIQLINNMGFPIVACVAMFWMLRQNQNTINVTLNGIQNTLKELTFTLKKLIGEDDFHAE